MSLRQYHKKRDFSKTKEPQGIRKKRQTHHLFVIQKHAASHLHYDFRIELQGVLKSWALPKGPSLDPSVKRLAVHVEDHPIEYGSFEGIIPKGQYGGGTVMLWDKGTWEPLDAKPYEAYEKGHLRFLIHAKKLNGRWDLIRFKDDKQWFLMKHQDTFARKQTDFDITHENKSILSHQSMEELTKSYNKIWTQNEAQKVKKRKTPPIKPTVIVPEGLSKSPFPNFIAPQLATLVDKAPQGDQWIHEIKLDGYRILAFKKNTKILLKSRNNKDWTKKFPVIAKAIAQLPFKEIVLDGEIVVLDSEGRSNFQLLQNSLKNNAKKAFHYFIFDLLYFEGYDVRHLSLIERKAILKNCLSTKRTSLHYNEHSINKGKTLFQFSCNHALEGIVSKKANGTYRSKRSNDWLKVKCSKRQEFVIGGYTPPQGKRLHFGSLLLGVYTHQGTLDFVGKVGTGFNKNLLKEIHQLLQKHQSATTPFHTKPSGYSNAFWVQPKLVCEVEFSEWTKGRHMRHPSFKGLRLDKKANEVMRELATPVKQVNHKQSPLKEKKTNYFLSNPDKVLYPEDGFTKRDLLSYYETVSEYILPFLSLRPLTLVRCPSHYKKCFYQRHFNKTTPKTLHALKDTNHADLIYLNDQKGLLSLVQMGVLEIHPWGSQITHLKQPDYLVLDLDPAPDVPWKEVVAAAREVRHYLEQYGLLSFVKSTGGKGLHIVVPILPEYDWSEVKNFTHVFVQFLEKTHPLKYISKMTKSKREGKVFIDYLRNQRAATAISAYSTRSRIHAPVSTPLFWDELSNHKEDNTFTLKTLQERLRYLKSDPWSDFWNIKQSLRLNTL